MEMPDNTERTQQAGSEGPAHQAHCEVARLLLLWTFVPYVLTFFKKSQEELKISFHE